MKIYGLYPRQWKPNYDWFRRQVGLLIAELANQNQDSKLILLNSPDMGSDERLTGATQQQLTDVGWWRKLELDALLFEGAANREYLPILKAVHASETKILAPLDTDGIVDPAVDFNLFWLNRFSWEKSRRRAFPALRATLVTLMKCIPPRRSTMDFCRRLQLLTLFFAESPLAEQRLARLFSDLGQGALLSKLRRLPHPIPTDRVWNSTVPKEKLLISAARWDDPQKDADLFCRVLANSLAYHEDYRAEIAGHATDELKRRLRLLAPSVLERIAFRGRLPNEQMSNLCERGQIFVIPSRAEGFSIAAADAVCSGCSIVAPALLGSMHYFTSHRSGSLAWERSSNAMSHAIDVEIAAWRDAGRDPAEISRFFCSELHADQVVHKLLEYLHSLR